MNQHPNYASHLHQCHIINCNGIGIKKTIKSLKGLRYAHSLSWLSCCTKLLVCTICMKRQSNSYRMEAHVEECSGITVKSSKT